MIILLLLLTIIYNIFAIIKNKGIPESISATSYILKPYLFTSYCVCVALLLLPVWLSLESITFLPFLSCSGILFAGATPFFKEDFQKPVHYISGILAVISYVLWLIFSGLYWLLAINLAFIIALVLIDRKNYVYYTEITELLTLLIYLL